MTAFSNLRALAEHVKSHTEKIAELIELENIAEPSFDPSSSKIPPSKQIEEHRLALNAAVSDLLLLVNGPLNSFRSFFTTHYELAAFQIALTFGVFEAVPQGSPIDLAQLAAKVGIDADRLRRVLRMLASMRVFHECQEEVFEHSASSILVATDSEVRDALNMQIDEMFRAASEASTCIKTSPYQSDAVNSPFYARHGMVTYDYYTKNPAKGARFARAMAGVTKMDREMEELKYYFPWDKLGKAPLVDIGGGSGHISMYLASQFSNLHVIVQDISTGMLGQGEAKKQEFNNIEGRIEFMQYDYFTPQPVRHAGGFLVRQVMHNWNDEKCVELLKNLAPAMEACAPNTPLLINDTILKSFGEAKDGNKAEERSLRQLDMAMFVVLGAKQRSVKEFEEILQKADKRFKIVKVHSSGPMGLLEIHLEH